MQLYQKYPPKTFEDITGHNTIVTEFKKRIKDNNISQNIFFIGNTGIGKGVFTKIIAKQILCSNLKDGQACNECDSCKAVEREENSYGFYMYNASSFGVDEARELEEIVKTKSFVSTKKVINIEEFQELFANKKAQKHLLKLLEKKNSKVHFIFTAMENKMDKAILNRCTVYKLGKLSDLEIATRLKYIAEKEGIDINSSPEKAEALFIMAGNSDGSLRTAIGYLERAIYGDIWKKEDLLKELDIVSDSDILEVVINMLNGRASFSDNIALDDNIINKIIYILMLSYKSQRGKELNGYEKQVVGKIPKMFSFQQVENVLRNIFDLFKFPYKTPTLSEFILLSSSSTFLNNDKIKLEEVKKNEPESSTNEESKRRRRRI
jgi:DNA polymerase-3 subunit gamma/tau